MSSTVVRFPSPLGIARLVTIVVSLLAVSGTQAQSPAPLAAPNLRIDRAGSVDAILRQPDGGIVFGGNFRSVDGVPRANLARLRPDGTLDPNWNPGTNNGVDALATDASGAIYVAGVFFSIGGQSRSRLAKLSSAGIVDPTWTPQPNGDLFALAVDASGQAYVGGQFTSIGGAGRAGIAKLSPSGTADASWNPGTNGLVTSLVLDASGNVFAAGSFSSIGGRTRAGLAKLAGSGSGAADATWNPAPSGTVFDLAMSPAGELFVAGAFGSIGGQGHDNLAKLSLAGAGNADATWNPAPNNPVVVIAFDPTGALYAAGSFNQIAGLARNSLARLNSSGVAVADVGFNPAATSELIAAIAIGSDGRVLVGGGLSAVAGATVAGMIVLSASGALLPSPEAEIRGEVHALVRQADGGLVVGGRFRRVDGVRRNNLARIRADGSLDTAWNASANGSVFALAGDAGGSVYVSGQFNRIDGVARGTLAKLDANGDLDTNWNSSTNSLATALHLDGSGSVFIAGGFNVAGGQGRNGLAKLSASTGALDLAWNPNANGGVASIVGDGAGSVFVGGYFSTIGGAARARIAKLSASGVGTADPQWNPGANAEVTLLAFDAGSLYAAGEFTSIGGAAIPRLARLAPTGGGSVDAAFDPAPLGTVQALAFGTGNVLHLGGSLFAVDGVTRFGLAKVSTIDGALDLAWNPEPFSPVSALVVDGEGAVFVGGQFSTIAGIARDSLAKLRTHYRRSYVAGANGTIGGNAAQIVQHGANATTVSATPAAGFHFVQWSDGSSANPRTDVAVTSDATLSASFGNDAPQIANVGATPGSLFEGESATIAVVASDREDALLSYRFDCNDDGVFERGPQPQATASCTFPAPGSRRVRVRVHDGPGASADASVEIAVADSVPQTTLSLPAQVDEDAPIPLTTDATIPSSAEIVAAIDIDCDFDGVQFDVDLSSSFPNPALACPGAPVGGERRIGARARDASDEAGPVVAATTQIRAINDAPLFSVGADVESNEDEAVVVGNWIVGFAPGPAAASDEAAQVLAFELTANSAPDLFALAPAVDTEGRLDFVPAPDANGQATLRVRLCDDGPASAPNVSCSVAQPFSVRILPVNDAPTAILATVPRQAAGSSGPRSLAGFATLDAGPDDEDASQAVADHLIDAVLDPDAVLVPGSVDVANDGTLHYTLTGASGSAAIALRVRDDGGTARGGVDTSGTLLFTIAVGAAADLQLALDNGEERLVDGETTVYALVVANAGPNAVTAATLSDELPATLVDVQWTCVASLSTGVCPPDAAGEGDIALAFDLDADRFLRFDLIARVDRGGGATAVHIAEAALPEGIAAIDASNDRAVDQDPILERGIFGGGFESPPLPSLTVTGAQEALRAR